MILFVVCTNKRIHYRLWEDERAAPVYATFLSVVIVLLQVIYARCSRGNTLGYEPVDLEDAPNASNTQGEEQESIASRVKRVHGAWLRFWCPFVQAGGNLGLLALALVHLVESGSDVNIAWTCVYVGPTFR